ncbi:hypothetical protein PIB30_106402, partial [Stylosanthes scabra]|nr:hypothetical protein [Stylosanthes scabra]
EREEIKEVQRKTKARLQTVTKLASHVLEHFIEPKVPHHEEGLSVVTLRFGTQLKGPTINGPNNTHASPMGDNLNEGVTKVKKITTEKKDEAIPDTQKRIVSAKDQGPLPYPVAAKRTRKTKTMDPCII